MHASLVPKPQAHKRPSASSGPSGNAAHSPRVGVPHFLQSAIPTTPSGRAAGTPRARAALRTAELGVTGPSLPLPYLGVIQRSFGRHAVQTTRAHVGGPAKDANERDLLEILGDNGRASLILSPIGVQGFVLGRGNLQISPDVIRTIGSENIMVIATPAKLARTNELHFDTGDPSLNASLATRGFWPVVTGYHKRRMVKVSANPAA